MRILPLLLFSTALILSLKALADPYNPRPEADDVVLTLPCQVSMAFRRIYTQYGKERLSDTRYSAGTAQSASPMAQSPHENYIQGPFQDEKGFYYLLLKYELQEGQYQALLNKSCPNLQNKALQLPKVNLSWFEAVEYARRLSLYLLSQPNKLDKSLTQAYARLPTDSEWEFAARGGLNVSKSEFEANLPPLKGQLADYAWYEGVKSANNHLHQPGLLEPNPLGLYDMLGNVQEMILEPFRLTRTGRLHGQSGGMMVRGGSYLTPASQLSSALRTEKTYYKGSEESKAKDTGVRLVLSLPVAGEVKTVRDLNTQVLALGSEESTGRQGGAEKLDTIAELDRLIAKTQATSEQVIRQAEGLKTANAELDRQNKDLNETLARLRTLLAASNTERDEMRDVAVAANLRLGSFLCSNLAQTQKQLIHQMESAVSYGKRCLETKSFCTVYQNYQAQIKDSQQKLKALSSYYGDIMAEGRSTYRFELFERALGLLKAEESKEYLPYLEQYFLHLKAYAKAAKDADENAQRHVKQCYLVMEDDGA